MSDEVLERAKIRLQGGGGYDSEMSPLFAQRVVDQAERIAALETAIRERENLLAALREIEEKTRYWRDPFRSYENITAHRVNAIASAAIGGASAVAKPPAGQWACGACGYFNDGSICTKCGKGLPPMKGP